MRSIVGPMVSIGWLWSARVLVAVVVAMILLCRLTGASIDDLTADGGGPFLSQFALAISLVFGILSPTILLPFSYAGTTRGVGSVVTGQTVFGPRRMDIRSSRCFTWSLPGNTGVSDAFRTLASSAIYAILFFSFACVVTATTAGAALGG